MADYIDWPGQSGNLYRYFLTDINLLYAVPANYALVRQLANGNLVPIYFGEAGNIKVRFQNHEKLPAAIQAGATHLMTHGSSEDEDVRCVEEKDLIVRWNPLLNIQHKQVSTIRR